MKPGARKLILCYFFICSISILRILPVNIQLSVFRLKLQGRAKVVLSLILDKFSTTRNSLCPTSSSHLPLISQYLFNVLFILNIATMTVRSFFNTALHSSFLQFDHIWVFISFHPIFHERILRYPNNNNA